MYKERNKTSDAGGGTRFFRQVAFVMLFLMLAGSLAGIGSLLFRNTSVLDEAGSGGTKVELANTLGASGQEGTQAKPFLITTAKDLADMRDAVNAGTNISGVAARTASYKLMADIDLGVAPYNTGVGWVPIGDADSRPFSGNFDGNKHAVKNMYMRRSLQFSGFFGVVTQTVSIKNLGMVDSDIYSTYPLTSASNSVGGIVGQVGVSATAGYLTIENCFNTGNVLSSVIENNTNNLAAGGIVGGYLPASHASSTITVKNCFNTGAVNGWEVGGILGNWHHAGSITNSFNAGYITGSDWLGGIIGHQSGNGSNLSIPITNCYNVGVIERTSRGRQLDSTNACGVGGISANPGGSTANNISSCYNVADIISNVTSTNPVNQCGQIVGFLTASAGGTISNCYYDSSKLPNAAFGTQSGTKISNINGLSQSSMLGAAAQTNMTNLGTIGTIGDGTGTTWVMTESGYPQLRCFAESDWLEVIRYSKASVNPAGFTDPGYVRNEKPICNSNTTVEVPSIGNGT